MNKRAAKTGENPEEEVELVENFEEVSGKKVELSLSYLDRVQEFISRNELTDSETVFYLYKFDNATAGNSKAFIAKYTEIEPPDEDQIGKKFGSGRYLVVMAVPKSEKSPAGHIKAFSIRIHQFYDTLNAPAAQQTPTIIQQPSNGLSDTISVISQLMAAFTPFFTMMQQNQQNQQHNSPDVSSLLFKTFENTQDVLKKSMLENVKVAADLQRKLIQVENGGTDMNSEVEEEEEPGLLETLKPLMMEYLPKLLDNNAQSKALQTVVKNTPQFKKIISNKREFKTLVAYLDKEKGPETTNKILANLKLKRV